MGHPSEQNRLRILQVHARDKPIDRNDDDAVLKRVRCWGHAIEALRPPFAEDGFARTGLLRQFLTEQQPSHAPAVAQSHIPAVLQRSNGSSRLPLNTTHKALPRS